MISAIVFENEEKTKYHIQNIQKRFAHHGVKWHMTYRPHLCKTTYVTVKPQAPSIYVRGIKYEQPKDRQEHVLDGFISIQQFINLMSFL